MQDKKQNSNYAAILAGGQGKRFWPLSRVEVPKQLLKITGKHSLLQHTFLRIAKIIPVSHIYIVTNRDYEEAIKNQIRELGIFENNIVVEPSPKNTAASIGLITNIIYQKNKEAVLSIFPADHFVKKEKRFIFALKKALKIAKEDKKIVILGINPQRAETGYGYIKADKTNKSIKDNALKIKNFIEKPEEKIAERLIKQDNIFWNSGIFTWKVSTILSQIKKFMPQLYGTLNTKNNRLFKKRWSELKSISIDYGILEKTKDNLWVIPTECGWTDLGNWSTIDFILPKDKSGNTIQGDALAIDSTNTTIWSSHHLVVALGLKDMIIADTPDAVLVCPKNQAQKVSKVVDHLKKNNRFEYLNSCLVERPWGKYIVLNDTGKFKTKIVEVYPHQRLSLQLHTKRAEHWVIVKGEAKVTINDNVHLIHQNESIFVPKGEKHRIENETSQKLIFIEIQTGTYLGEDDIKRFEDDYKRNASAKRKDK